MSRENWGRFSSKSDLNYETMIACARVSRTANIHSHDNLNPEIKNFPLEINKIRWINLGKEGRLLEGKVKVFYNFL